MNGILKSSKSKIKMPWIMLATAFIFIFNPNISIVDVFPDFIGYIIISVALTRPSMISETLADAKKSFDRMILIDIGKYFALVWVFGIDSLSERASSLLLWSFVFSVLETIFLIPSYLKLFKGLSDLGDYYENVSIHKSSGKSGKSYTEKTRTFTLFFIIFKAVMCVLPELADFGNLADYQAHSTVNLYRYIGVMRFLCCVPVVIVGIVWLINIMRYFVRISKDTAFNSAINEHYQTAVLPKKGLFTIRHIKTASWFFVASAVLTLDFTLEDVNVLPDVLVVALIIPSFVYFCKTASLNKRGTYAFTALYGIFAVISSVVKTVYLNNYTYNAMDRDVTAFTIYMGYVVAVALQGIFFVLMLSSFVKQLKSVVSQNTGYVLGKEINTEREKKRIEAVHLELNKEFSQILNVAVIYVISDVFYSLYGAMYAFLRKDFGFLGVVNIACGFWFVGMAVRALDDLKDAVKTKYMLE